MKTIFSVRRAVKVNANAKTRRVQEPMRILLLILAAIAVLLWPTIALAEKKDLDAGPPLANDFGPEKVDVSGYPEDIQAGYTLMLKNCTKCHTATRVLGAQFAQPAGKKKEQAAKLAEFKADEEKKDLLFGDKNVLKLEANIWRRYVKRMMAKPGADIAKADGKRIYKFLVHDSIERKLNKPQSWVKARKKMLAAFKEKHPEEYKKNYVK